MKKTRKFAVAALALISLAACSKNDNNNAIADEDVAVSQELLSSEVMENELSSSFTNVILASETTYSSNSATAEATLQIKSATTSNCGTVSIEPLLGAFPKTITIDFGDGCVDGYGVTRSGSVAITVTDYLHAVGAEYHVVFSSFAVNGYMVNGTFDVENTGTASQPAFTEDMDLTFTGTGGTTIHKMKSVERTWVEGSSTQTLTDDVFQITGSADVESSTGYYYSYDITSPLKLHYGCDPITEGIIVLSVYGQTDQITIDFGDGTCDWKVRLSQAGKSEMDVSFGE